MIMDSVVIPVGKVAVYLDKSLKALGLHTEARTSFIMCVHMHYLSPTTFNPSGDTAIALTVPPS
jgi:hypothetical protein